MKSINTLLAAFSLAAIVSPSSFAQEKDIGTPAPAKAAAPASATKPAATSQTSALIAETFDEGSLKALSPGDVRTLMRILSLPPEKLDSLRQSIDALAKMTPAEKQALRKKLETLRNGPLPPPRNRDNPLLRYWNTLSPEARKTETEKFQKMTREERRAYVGEVLKKFPPPPRQERQGPRAAPPHWGIPLPGQPQQTQTQSPVEPSRE